MLRHKFVEFMPDDISPGILYVSMNYGTHIITQAKLSEFNQLSLETGSMDYFLPAHALYLKHGFTFCGPFSDYQADPNSKFMSLDLTCRVSY